LILLQGIYHDARSHECQMVYIVTIVLHKFKEPIYSHFAVAVRQRFTQHHPTEYI